MQIWFTSQAHRQWHKAQVSGDVQISTANSQVIVDADLWGGDMVAMGAVTNAVAFYVMADPAISSVADLKGKELVSPVSARPRISRSAHFWRSTVSSRSPTCRSCGSAGCRRSPQRCQMALLQPRPCLIRWLKSRSKMA